MDDSDLISAMHCLGEDLTRMASELADRRGMKDCAQKMIEARADLAVAYSRILTRED